jgi:RNA polymerase sigma factor (sigma-70 family)
MPTSAAVAAELGSRIEAGLVAQHRLLSGPDDDAMAADLQVIAADGRAATEQLIAAHIDLVHAIAERYKGRGLEQADVVQEGCIGLMRAVAEFDYTTEEFATVAAWWIRRAVRQAIHDYEDPSPTTAEVELGMPAGRARYLAGGPPELVSLDAPAQSADPDDPEAPDPLSAQLYDPGDPSTEGLALAALGSAALDSALTELGDPAAAVVRCRFGLGPDPPMSLLAASRATGMAPERVRQFEDRAIRQLRDRGSARLLA